MALAAEPKQLEDFQDGGGATRGLGNNNVPVMRHVIPDGPSGEVSSNFDPVKISHAVTLLTDPHSKDMTRRHLHIINKIVIQYSEGFYLKDLVDILGILNACADRCLEQEKYIKPMIDLTNILATPCKKEKLSDEVAYKEVLKGAYAQLGFLLRVPNNDLQLKICQTLLEIYQGTDENNQSKLPNTKRALPSIRRKTKGGNKKQQAGAAQGDGMNNNGDTERDDDQVGYQRVSVEHNRWMLEESEVAETLVKALSLLEPSSEVTNVIFQLLRCLTTKSKINCDLMINAHGAALICNRLPEVEQVVTNGLYLVTEILWNLLEFGDAHQVTEQLSNMDCLGALHDAFLNEVPKTHSHHHRTLRNDLLAITNLLTRCNPNAPFIEVGFARTCLLLFTCVEVKSHHSLTRHLKFSKSEEDFEFKRMLLSVVINLSENKSMLPLMKEYKLLVSMLHYLQSPPKNHSTWLQSQFEEIQLQVLASLPLIANNLLDELVGMEGMKTINEFLDWCVISEADFKGHGNSVYASGTRGTKLAQTNYIIRLIRRLIKSGNELVIQDLINSGLITKYLIQLNTLVSDMEQTPTHEFEPTNQCLPPHAKVGLDITCEILYSFAHIAESNIERKDLIGEDGIQLMMSILRLEPGKVCLGLGYKRLMLVTLETIWECVCGSYNNELVFLQMEGAFVLLDLLEKQLSASAGHKSPHLISALISTLLDCMENPKTLQHVTEWAGKKELKVAKLMINVWIDNDKTEREEREEEAKRSFIKDLNNPLNTELAPPAAERNSTELSPSVMQVSNDIRPKIFGFFCKLGFNELQGLEQTDYIWLTVIEKYLDFKMAEVWSEIVEELEFENKLPIGQDRQAMEAILRVSRERAESTLANQKDRLNNYQQQEIFDEQMVYAEIKETHKQHAKLLWDFENYVARTSNYHELLRAKKEQMTSIENSRINNDVTEDKDFHVTSIDAINATVFASQIVTSDHLPIVLNQTSTQKQSILTASSKRGPHFAADENE